VGLGCPASRLLDTSQARVCLLAASDQLTGVRLLAHSQTSCLQPSLCLRGALWALEAEAFGAKPSKNSAYQAHKLLNKCLAVCHTLCQPAAKMYLAVTA
jgi:hypothetical protein